MNLNQVTIPVTNVEASIAFYEKLGLILIVRALPHYARFECPDGDATFSIHQSGSIDRSGDTWIYFEVDDPEEKIRGLMAKDIPVDALPEDKPWLWKEAHLKDPDGNRIIIYRAGNNRKYPPWRIG
ncbi:MAG: VOC family protein [Chitinophagaceae bacterium]|nr:VOC family protein [Chitinophagaceae bacterium]MCW5927811.1 VOC family protein [Chitinophagaceae bacterium]